MNERELADRLEAFMREQFSISPSDPHFARDVDIYAGGYVDSVGMVELLGFIEDEFGLDIPDDDLVSDEFSTIDGIARTIERLQGSPPGR